MINFLSASSAIIPMLVYLLIIWKFDRHEKKPLSLVLQNYLWGASGAVFLTFIFGTLLNQVLFFFNLSSNKYFETIIAAPVVEEIMKGIFLLFTMTNSKFDNMTDGMVYGGAIGLGFGATENFLYYITYGTNLHDLIFLIIVRTFFSAVMHCIATATFGAFSGYVKYSRGIKKIIFPLIGLFLAIIIHVTWNSSVSFNAITFSGFISMIITVTVFIFVFAMSVNYDKKIISNELEDEVTNGVIPFEYLSIINSGERHTTGWIEENKRKAYINAATTLAFRKMQIKNASGPAKYLCEKDIEYYRTLLQKLLTKDS